MSWFISEMTAAMAQLRPDGVASSPLGPTVFPGRFVVLQLFKHFNPIKSSQHITARAFSWNFWTLRHRKQVLAPTKCLGQHQWWGPSRRERHRDRCKSETACWFRPNCPAQNLVCRCWCLEKIAACCQDGITFHQKQHGGRNFFFLTETGNSPKY